MESARSPSAYANMRTISEKKQRKIEEWKKTRKKGLGAFCLKTIGHLATWAGLAIPILISYYLKPILSPAPNRRLIPFFDLFMPVAGVFIFFSLLSLLITVAIWFINEWRYGKKNITATTSSPTPNAATSQPAGQTANSPQVTTSYREILNMEPTLWYYIEGGRQKGPITEEEILRLLSSNRLPGNTPVWNQELKDWAPASSLGRFAVPSPPPPVGYYQASHSEAASPPQASFDFSHEASPPPTPPYTPHNYQQHPGTTWSGGKPPEEKLYLWNTQALAQQLKAGLLSQNAKMKHLLFYITAVTVGLELFQYLETTVSLLSVIESLLAIAITFFGTLYCYNLNGKGDNRDFIDRYICLSVPIGIRLFLLFGVLILPVAIFQGVMEELVSGKSDIVGAASAMLLLSKGWEFVIAIAWPLCNYWRIAVHIRQISGARN